ncbi:hypothetical protein C0995_014531, partial [Termitomyces sp. Mi166
MSMPTCSLKAALKNYPLTVHNDHKIDLEEGMLLPFGKIYNMSEVELCVLKDYLDNMPEGRA